MTKARDIASAAPAPAGVTSTELGYVDGVTSALQTQINNKIGQSTAINPTIVDAKGDIIAATAADTVARLAVGADNTVLTADSATATGLKWATSSAGGMTLLGSGSLGTSNGVTISTIDQGYKNLILYVKNAQASADFYYGLRFNGDSGANYSFNLLTNNASSAFISTYQNQDYTYSSSHELNGSQYFTMYEIFDYANSTTRKSYRFQQDGLIYDSSFKTESFGHGQWHPSTAAAITSLTIRCNTSVNFSAGTYEIYGVK